MPPRHSELAGEPSIPEMLADPIVQAVMARDGVTQREVEGLINTARRKFARMRIEPRQTDCPVSAATAVAE